MPRRTAYDDTAISVARSQEEIKELLARFNVTATRFTSFPSYALMEFIRKTPAGPVPFRVTIKPKPRLNIRNAAREMDQAERQVWRVVKWWLKAKLEAIEFGLVEFEQDFLPYMLLADSRGQSAPAAQVFFQRLSGRVGSSSDDPFGGLRPALPPGEPKGPEALKGGM